MSFAAVIKCENGWIVQVTDECRGFPGKSYVFKSLPEVGPWLIKYVTEKTAKPA